MKQASVRVARSIAIFLLASAASVATAAEAVRIDASSDAAAERSFKRMTESVAPADRLKLSIAILQLNMTDGANAVGATKNAPPAAAAAVPGNVVEAPSAHRIRQKIAGLDAAAIIALADASATNQTIARGQEGGLPKELMRPLEAGQLQTLLAGTIWNLRTDTNGFVDTERVTFGADHTLAIAKVPSPARRATSKAPAAAGASRWEQSGAEVRLLLNDGNAVYLGRFSDAATLTGSGANKLAGRWTWSATKAP